MTPAPIPSSDVRHYQARGLFTFRAACESALAAIDAGDWHEAEKLLALAVGRPQRAHRRSFRCPCCGKGFGWPGQLDDHLATVHPHEAVVAT